MRRRSVLAVVVVRVPSDILRSFLGRVGGLLSLFGGYEARKLLGSEDGQHAQLLAVR